MPRINVSVDPDTGEYLEDNAEYVRHFKGNRPKSTREVDKLAILDHEQSFINRMHTSCRTFAEIETFINNNWKIFCYRGWKERQKHDAVKKPVPNVPVLLSVSLQIDRFTEIHEPRKAEEKGKAVAHLGYAGKLVISVAADDHQFHFRDMFEGTSLILTDGYQGYLSSYKVILLLKDWPGLEMQAAQDRLLEGANPLLDEYYRDRD